MTTKSEQFETPVKPPQQCTIQGTFLVENLKGRKRHSICASLELRRRSFTRLVFIFFRVLEHKHNHEP
jgi:hypothetical protein